MHRISVPLIRSTFRSRPRRVCQPRPGQSQAFHRSCLLRAGGNDSRDSAARPTLSSTHDTLPTVHQAAADDSRDEAPSSSSRGEGRPKETLPNSIPVAKMSSRDLGYLQYNLDIQDLESNESGINAKTGRSLKSGEQVALEQQAGEAPEWEKQFQDLLRAAYDDALKTYGEEMLESMPGPMPHGGRIQEPPPTPPNEEGIFAMGEEEGQKFPDEPYEGDDVTTLAHTQLDQQRELRRYMRIVAWEMPHLTKFAKPFELPAADQPLRFRYTTYMGESHPAENKVVLEFCTADLPLKPKERLKLIKLVGVRYDPQLDLVKMSCESFSSQAQNKRYLGDLVDNLVKAAKGEGDTLAAKDSFQDIPVSFRHVKWKKSLKFPETWKLDGPKRQQLAAQRASSMLADTPSLAPESAVDGKKIIEESYALPNRLATYNNRAGRVLQGRVERMQRTGTASELR